MVNLILLCALLLAGAAAARADAPADSRDETPAPTAAGAAGAPTSAASFWSDPTFQKQFLGSYGVLSELEPKITEAERPELQRILPLLSSDPQTAATEIEKILTPSSSAIYDFILGNIRYQEGDLERAAHHYTEALAKFPAFRRASRNLGMIQVRNGSFEEGAATLGRVIETGGGDGTVYGLLGYAAAAAGRLNAAETAYRNAVLLQPAVLDWQVGLMQSVYRQHKHDEALALIQELLAVHPERTDLWLLQASCRMGLKQHLKAAEDYEIVRRMGKAGPPVLNTLGDIYANEKLWDLAAGAYREAIEQDAEPDPNRALRNVEVLAQRDALEQARNLLASVRATIADRLDDTGRRRLLKIESRIAAAEGREGEAAGILEQIVAIDPLDGEALMMLGEHHARGGDLDKAAFYFERASGLEAFEAEAKTRQAQVLVKQSRYREAVPLLRRAQEIRPRDDVARYLDQVERVAKSRG